MGVKKKGHLCQNILLQWEPHGSQRQTDLGSSHVFSTEKRHLYRDSVDLPEPQFLAVRRSTVVAEWPWLVWESTTGRSVGRSIATQLLAVGCTQERAPRGSCLLTGLCLALPQRNKYQRWKIGLYQLSRKYGTLYMKLFYLMHCMWIVLRFSWISSIIWCHFRNEDCCSSLEFTWSSS